MISIDEYEALCSLTKSKAFRYLRNLETKTCQEIQVEVNKAVKGHRDRQAGEFMARYDGVRLLLRLVKDKVKQYELERD